MTNEKPKCKHCGAPWEKSHWALCDTDADGKPINESVKYVCIKCLRNPELYQHKYSTPEVPL